MSGPTTDKVARRILHVLRSTEPSVHANLMWRVNPVDYAQLRMECTTPFGVSAPDFEGGITVCGVPVGAHPQVEELK